MVLSAEQARPVVLIVDDTAANLKVANGHLRGYGFEILSARDGESGLERARLGRPDLILLDVQMPGIDGYETCRRLKSDPDTAEIPVIFMTVLDEAQDKVRAFDVGAVDYVTKPLEAAELLARVRAHLQLRRLHLQAQAQAEQLELTVAERTQDLAEKVDQLARERAEREGLVEVVREQAEQLRELTQRWMNDTGARDRQLASDLREEVHSRLGQVKDELEEALKNSEMLGISVREPIAAPMKRALSLLAPALDRAGAVEQSLSKENASMDANPLLRLSTREYEVLQFLAQGRSNKEIAFTLGVARTTVSTYRTRIMEKLGVEDLASLVRLVARFEQS